MNGLLIWMLGYALAAPLSPDEAVSLALDRSVSVAEAEADLERSRGRARAAGFLRNDPQVGASWAVVGDQLEISASQRLSLTGEGLAERRSAMAALDAAEARLRRARVELAAEVRVAWTLAVDAQQRVLLAEEAMDLATLIRVGAERRLETGEGALLDARLARVEEAEAIATWMAGVSVEGDALAELAAITGRPIGDIELSDDPLHAAPAVTGDAAARSDVAAARHEMEAAQAALRRERAATLPPVAIGAFFEQEGEELRIGPSVRMTVPVWQRNSDGRADAKAELRQADARLTAVELRAASETDSRRRVVDRLATVVEGRYDVREEASAALASIALGYESGELDLLTAALLRREILDGQRAWLDGRRVLARSRIDLMLAEDNPALLEAQ